MSSAGLASWEIDPSQRRIVAAAAALVVVVVLGAALLFGRSAHAAAERAKAKEIEEESRVFCVSLGLASADEAYGRCVSGLASIRRRHEDRLNAEAMGVF
jgi:hypothetical protein